MRILVLGDIHIGSIKDTNYVYNVITDIFEKELIFNKIDAVIFLGDLFHRLMKVNEEYTSLAINIMSYLVRICRGKEIKIRLLYGTESHEMGQYRLFNYHLTNTIDMKLIDTVSEEELFPGVNVLYFPEEYVESKEHHYSKYFQKKYDYVLGHGIISEGMPMMAYDTGAKSNEKKVPHFKSKELSSICKLCIFSHYHIHTRIEKNVYYLGSLFRDSFGEEEDKGYGIIEDGKFTFVKNEQAHIYRTYTFEEDSNVYIDTENLISEIKTIKEDNKEIFEGERYGRIRLIFKLPQGIDQTFKETLRSLLFNDKYISPLIKEQSEVIQEVQETIDDEYNFILDNSLAVTDKIHRYINKQYESDMSLEELTKYINEEFKV